MTEARMQQTPEYKAGTFCWMELTTSDGEAAKKFYTELFGWTFEDRPIGPGMVYTMLKLDGKDTGALYEDKQKLAQGIPPHWLAYFAVEDCDAKVHKATELGASVMKPAEDIPGVGRFAILNDPQGAVFAIIKTEPHQ